MTDVPGSSDCEARTASLQPVLFATSWSYVVVGIALGWWVANRQDISRLWGSLFAAGVVATGLGSVDYHGLVLVPQPLVHDAGLALALLAAWGVDLTRLTGNSRRASEVVAVVGVAGAVLLIVWPAGGPVLAAVIGVGLVLSELLIYRRGLRGVHWSQYGAIATLVAGFVVFALSRSGGPLCDPESWIQGHGAWHILSAAALGLWAIGALPGSVDPSSVGTGQNPRIAGRGSDHSGPSGAHRQHTKGFVGQRSSMAHRDDDESPGT